MRIKKLQRFSKPTLHQTCAIEKQTKQPIKVMTNKFLSAGEAKVKTLSAIADEQSKKNKELKTIKSLAETRAQNEKINNKLSELILGAALKRKQSITWEQKLPKPKEWAARGFLVYVQGQFNENHMRFYTTEWNRFRQYFAQKEALALVEKFNQNIDITKMKNAFGGADNALQATSDALEDAINEIFEEQIDNKPAYDLLDAHDNAEFIYLYKLKLNKQWRRLVNQGKIDTISPSLWDFAAYRRIDILSALKSALDSFYESLIIITKENYQLFRSDEVEWSMGLDEKEGALLKVECFRQQQIFNVAQNKFSDDDNENNKKIDGYMHSDNGYIYSGTVLLPPPFPRSKTDLSFFGPACKPFKFIIAWPPAKSEEIPIVDYVNADVARWVASKCGQNIIGDIFDSIERVSCAGGSALNFSFREQSTHWSIIDCEETHHQIIHPSIILKMLESHGYTVKIKQNKTNMQLEVGWN